MFTFTYEIFGVFFGNTLIYSTPEIYDTKDKQTLPICSSALLFQFFSGLERTCRPKKKLGNQDNRSFIKIPED